LYNETDIVVAADGSGDYRTVQEAINSIPADNSQWVNIAIRKGLYKEKLHIEKKFVIKADMLS